MNKKDKIDKKDKKEQEDRKDIIEGIHRTDKGGTYSWGKFWCKVKTCKKFFKRRATMLRHYDQDHMLIRFPCREEGCVYKAKSNSDLKKHKQRMHPEESKFVNNSKTF